jgi:hypothetical protein
MAQDSKLLRVDTRKGIADNSVKLVLLAGFNGMRMMIHV